jgi:hypothetical protein
MGAPKRTGKSVRQPPVADIAVERARDARVVERVRRGESFDTIADAEGYADRSGPWRAFWRAVRRVEHDAVDQMRAVQNEQIDAALEKWLPQMLDLDATAANVVLRIWERQAKLNGLDAPARMIAGVLGDGVPEDPKEREAVLLSLVERIEQAAHADRS